MYIPVLRYRLAERQAFKTLGKTNIFTSDKIMPLIEVIQHYPTGRIPKIPKSFEQIYTEELQTFKFPILLDIPTYFDLNLKKIDERYRNFLFEKMNHIDIRINYILKLSKMPNIIPVASYNPNNNQQPGVLALQESAFRNGFMSKPICFRIFPGISRELLVELKELIKAGDIVLLDLLDEDYKINKFKNLYSELYDMKRTLKCTIGLIYSPIPNKFISSSIDNDSVVKKLNNGLLKEYKELGYDHLGDFSGAKRDMLIESFRGIITNLYYCSENNKYIGFTAKPSKDPKDFAVEIAPSIINSAYWKSYSDTHHFNCPGCTEIKDKLNNISHPGNRSTWKSVSIQHYIYSINEIL